MMWRPLRTNATGAEGKKGDWWKMGQVVYALWVSASANIIIIIIIVKFYSML